MPLDIQRPELVAALQKRYGLVGRTGFVMDEVVVPVVSIGDLEDLSLPVIAAGTAGGSPAAGQFFRFELANDQGTGNLVRVRRLFLTINGTSTTSIDIGFDTPTGGASTGTRAYEDGRITRVPPVSMRTVSLGALSLTTPIMNWRSLVGGTLYEWTPIELYIEENQALAVEFRTSDVGGSVSAEWEEIPPEQVVER